MFYVSSRVENGRHKIIAKLLPNMVRDVPRPYLGPWPVHRVRNKYQSLCEMAIDMLLWCDHSNLFP